jgi:hypothetical protein
MRKIAKSGVRSVRRAQTGIASIASKVAKIPKETLEMRAAETRQRKLMDSDPETLSAADRAERNRILEGYVKKSQQKIRETYPDVYKQRSGGKTKKAKTGTKAKAKAGVKIKPKAQKGTKTSKPKRRTILPNMY